MTRSDAQRPVLIVQPPMISPAQDLSPLRRWAESLHAGPLPVDLCDANRAFYERFLVSTDGTAGWLRKLLGAGDLRVEEAARAMMRMEELLSVFSAAVSPTQVGWGWVLCPALQGPGDVDVFVRDRGANPFLEMAESFADAVSVAGYGAVGFWAADEVQGPAALTLADACRQIAPGVQRLLITPAGKMAQGGGCFHRCLDADQHADPADFHAPCPDGTGSGRREDLPRKTGQDTGLWAHFTVRLASGRKKDRGKAPSRVIRWRIEEQALSTLTGQLKKTARDGFWNHLDLFGAPADPDRPEAPPAVPWIHSLCRWEAEPFWAAGARPTWPKRVDRYAGVKPLPGVPFWCVVKDPALIERWLEDTSVDALSRWRVEAAAGSAFRLGVELDYRFLAPSALSAEEMDEICAMVLAGGSVGARWVRHNLERAYLIGVVTERGVIVANSSLKHPRREYIEKVSRAAGIDLSGFLERGYTSVRPEYRNLGIGTRLLEGLTARAQGHRIFSIIGEDNADTQKIALHNRTQKVVTFYSQALGKNVGLWMPEATAAEVIQHRKGS